MGASLSGVFSLQEFTDLGLLAAGYRLYTYAPATTNLKVAYTDAAGSIPHTYTADGQGGQYIALNARGELPAPLFLLSGGYDITLKTVLGVTVWTRRAVGGDDSSQAVSAALADTSDLAKADAMLGVKSTAVGAVATTQHQVNEEDASVFRFFSAAQIAAVEAETGLAGAVVDAQAQSALDGVRAGATLGLNRFPVGEYLYSKPQMVKSGTPRMTLRGDNRIRSILMPNAVSIALAPVNVNAMYVNQDNNPHLCMENLRFTSAVGYTGVGIYSVELGGADGSAQCLFSGIFRNLWVDFASTNAGFLTGGSQNTVFDTITFENMKGAFTLVGVGNGDNFRTNLSFAGCFDQAILQTADTNGSFAETVRSVHAYIHQRGRLFDIQNWFGGCIEDIYFEAATGNLGTTGIGRFKSCVGLMLAHLYALPRAGVPLCDTALEFDSTTAKIHHSYLGGTFGVKISGTGAVALDFVDCDFTGCTTAAMQFLTNFTGTVRTTRCKFNSSQGYCVVSQVNGSNDWFSCDDEFVDAGLGGVAGFRNISLATSGKVVLMRPRIGRTTGSAAAQYWIEATGSGTVDIYDPIFVGTPPAAYISPATTQTVNFHITPAAGIRTTTVAAYTVVDSDYDLIANLAGVSTYTLPNPALYPGRVLRVKTITANTVISASANVVALAGGAAGTAICAAAAGNWKEMKSDGVSWIVMAGN